MINPGTYPAIHGRTLALVQAHRRKDWEGARILLDELGSPEVAGATLASLLKVLDYFIDQVERGDVVIAEMSLIFAAQEGNPSEGG